MKWINYYQNKTAEQNSWSNMTIDKKWNYWQKLKQKPAKTCSLTCLRNLYPTRIKTINRKWFKNSIKWNTKKYINCRIIQLYQVLYQKNGLK